MRNLITIVLALGLVGCVDGEEAPVATVTAPAPPARALVARQMPTLPSLPSLPEPATSDPWAPTNVYENGEGGAEALYDEEGHEIDLDEERALARAAAEHDYEDEGAGEHDYGECAEGCGEYQRDYDRDEANDPINLPEPAPELEGAGPACEDCD